MLSSPSQFFVGYIFYKYFRWFCHFDDDIYVNVPALVAILGKYNPTEERWYLGRWSVNRKEKIEVLPWFYTHSCRYVCCSLLHVHIRQLILYASDITCVLHVYFLDPSTETWSLSRPRKLPVLTLQPYLCIVRSGYMCNEMAMIDLYANTHTI